MGLEIINGVEEEVVTPMTAEETIIDAEVTEVPEEVTVVAEESDEEVKAEEVVVE